MSKFCPSLLTCEEPIAVIAEIMSENLPESAVEIENKFKSIGISYVNDLADAPYHTVHRMNLGKDSMTEAYNAVQIYEARYSAKLKDAKSEFDQGNYNKTQEICYNMLSSKPNDIHVLNLLGVSYFKLGESEKSLEYFKKILDHNEKCPEVLNNVGTVLFYSSHYYDAWCYYYTALKHSNCSVNIWINFASATIKLPHGSIKTNNLKLSNFVYSIILTHYPKMYIARNMSGSILLVLKETKKAKKQYMIAKNDNQEYPDTWNNLGNVYLITNKFEKAILHYKKALELNSNLINAWLNLGIAYAKLNKYENSIEHFQKVLLLCPENVSAVENLATIYEHNLKDITLAVEYYKKLLVLKPNWYRLNLKLGYLYFSQLKKIKESKLCFTKCIELNPENVDAYRYLVHTYDLTEMQERLCAAQCLEKLGDLYESKNNLKKAYAAYTCSLEFDPENASGHWKLGRLLQKKCDFDEALLRYKKAIDLQPNFPEAYYDAALVYESMNFLNKAIIYYNMALKLQPDYKNILLNLSNLQFKLGNFDEAANLYEEINEIDNPEETFGFLIKLANAFYKEMKSFDKAVRYYKKALKIDRTCLDVYLNAGRASLEMKRIEEALYFFQQAIELNPQSVIAYTNIGFVYSDSGNLAEAIQSYKTALNIESDYPDAYCNLVQCLKHICEWSDHDNRVEKLKDIIHQQLENNLVPSLLARHSVLYPFSSEVLKKIASAYAEQCIQNILATKIYKNYSYQTSLHLGRIRVGYVSSDFGDCPTSQLMESIVNCHDRKKLEIFCYSLSADDGTLSWSNISSASDHFKSISHLNVVDAANLINADGIHVLVNMNGYTEGARNEIFALRPAPIQALWLGCPTTSGAKFIDYLITDEVCSPLESKQFYTEQFAYMDRTVFIGDHKQKFGDLQPRVRKTETDINTKVSTDNVDTDINTIIPFNNGNMDIDKSSNESVLVDILDDDDDSEPCYTRELFNIPEDVVVYCNFSQFYKIDPSTFKMWATILHNVPNSVLWLLRFSADGEDNLRKHAAELDIDSSRIIFSDIEPQHKHMQRIQLADVYLDTPLYNGNKSCLDAIWAGTPIVTLPKETVASRIATSLLTTLGNTSTVAENECHYIELATSLGVDKSFLDFQKQFMWSSKSASKLFDCQSYAEELEAVYRNMWTNFLHNTSKC